MSDAPDRQIQRRIEAVKNRLRSETPEVKQFYEMVRGNQYVYVANKALQTLPTTTILSATGPRGKPPHKARPIRNLIIDSVAHEISAATGRIPSYDVVPTSSDPKRIEAASLAEKVLLYGYEKWQTRQAFVKLAYHAVVGDEGFIWSYFDNQRGKPIDDEVSTGEICHRVFSKLEVGWQSGVRFEDARWYVIQQARPIDDVKDEYGIQDVKADATPITLKTKGSKSELVLVTDYIERPTAKNPDGRWLTVCNEKTIATNSYPCVDGKGNVCDEPVLHKLAYFTDADSDRDMGLVRHLVDAQRTYNDAVAKLIEFKNLMMVPQMIAVKNSIVTPPSEEPGAITYYKGSVAPSWRTIPNIPAELFQIAEQAKADIQAIAAQNDVPDQVQSGKAIQAFTERDIQRRADFLQNLSSVYAAVGRHDLYLVQNHYTDARLLSIEGTFGFEPIPDFRGSDLLNQADVRVYAESIEPRTRAGIQQEAQTLLQVGAITPLQYMVAVKGGAGVSLADDYLFDMSRANEIVQSIRLGTFFNMPERPVVPGEDRQMVPTPGPPDPTTGMPGPTQMTEQPIIDPTTGEPITNLPGWMPRPFDNLDVHESVISNFMKTPTFTALDPAFQEAAGLYYGALQDLKAKKAAKDAQEQQSLAQGLGMANAASPTGNPAGNGSKPLPSLPATQT